MAVNFHKDPILHSNIYSEINFQKGKSEPWHTNNKYDLSLYIPIGRAALFQPSP